MPPATNAVAISNEDNLAQINEALRSLGLMAELQERQFYRAKVNGTTFEMEDEVFPSNQKTNAPAFYGRLADRPLEFQGLWLTDQDAEQLNRPGAANHYCKSYAHIPEQAGKFAEDGTACGTCPVNPYTKKGTSILENAKKCQFRADVLFQRTDELGQVVDDRVWSMSLPTTSLIEYQGMRNKEPEKGFVSELNTVQRVARLAITAFPELPVVEAVTRGGTLLALGGVVMAFRIKQVKSEDGSRSFPLIQLDPVNIITDMDIPAPALALAASDAWVEPDADLPF